MVADAASLVTPSFTVTNDPNASEAGRSFSEVSFPDEGVILPTDAQIGNRDLMALGSGMSIAAERSFGARMPIVSVFLQIVSEKVQPDQSDCMETFMSTQT